MHNLTYVNLYSEIECVHYNVIQLCVMEIKKNQCQNMNEGKLMVALNKYDEQSVCSDFALTLMMMMFIDCL